MGAIRIDVVSGHMKHAELHMVALSSIMFRMLQLNEANYNFTAFSTEFQPWEAENESEVMNLFETNHSHPCLKSTSRDLIVDF